MYRYDNARHRHEPRVDQLRSAWYSAVDRRSWPDPGVWWTWPVETLVRAIVSHRDVRPAISRLGRVRARAGLKLSQTLDDLNALYDQLPQRMPPAHLVRVLVDGWAAEQSDLSTRPRNRGSWPEPVGK